MKKALHNIDKNIVILSDTISLSANKQWQKIAVEGTWEGHWQGGTFNLNIEKFKEIIDNYTNSTLDIVCDYEHESVWGFGDNTKASGWVKREPISLKIEKDELFAKIEWTNKAYEYIKNDEYKYISPTFSTKTADRVTGKDIGWSLHSIALTNKPFLEELPSISINKNLNLNKKEEEEDMPQSEELKALSEANSKIEGLTKENLTLTNEVKELKESLSKQNEEAISKEVDGLIDKKLFSKEQKESLIALAKSNKEQFNNLVKNQKASVVVPPSDLFINKDGSTVKDGNLSEEELEA